MVFEGYVVELVNKFAGQYLDNLDPSQLKLGIWGGDAKLESLSLKESALDDLDLPVKVLQGHLGKLVLKIPWKNLYTEPVIAQIDGLYLLVRPNTGIKYNAEKEEKALQEKKKRQLEAIELAKKIEEEKKKSAPKKEEKDSFVEKLAMQVVKNLQVYIENIHVRYEDCTTDPSAPFSIGITLENLSAQSTDENWIPKVLDSAVQMIHKAQKVRYLNYFTTDFDPILFYAQLVKLDSLSLYWNTNDPSIGQLPTKEEWVEIAKKGIATTTAKRFIPEGFKYVLQPISATTKAKLNLKPGSDLSIPKVFLSLVLQEISLMLSRNQFHDIMELLESFDLMSRNSAFRKYKPDVPLNSHAKEWWKYAMNSILEEDVRRRFRNWSWKHMKHHRMICNEYKELFKKKLLQDKPSESLMKSLEKLEDQLDVLNITICRQQAEFEEAAAIRKKKKKAEEKEKNGGWFSSFWGSGKKKKGEEEKQSEILTKDQKQEQLDKLYAAIGYSENEAITAFPKEYVENQVLVHLKQISVTLRDDTVSGESLDVAKLSLQDLYANLNQRPSAQAIKVSVKMDKMKVFGAPGADGKMPLLVTSQESEVSGTVLALFRASFETNPLDGKCDQRAEVASQPLIIVYDSNTVEQIVNFFQPPKDVHLEELSAAAQSRLEDLKSVSKASLSYAIEHHKITDVNLDLKSPYIIIPENGRFHKSASVLVVDLGHLKITSDRDQERIKTTKDLSIEELEKSCYDKFDLRLEALQVLIAKPGEDWQSARKQTKSNLHILEPLALDIKLQKALNPDDVRLSQIKVSGSLPSVSVGITDKKLQQVIQLATSIPIPGADAKDGALPESRPRSNRAKRNVGAVRGTITRDIARINASVPVQEVFHDGKRYFAYEAYPPAVNVDLLKATPPGEEDEDDEEFVTPEGTPVPDSALEKATEENKLAVSKQIKLHLKFEIEEISVAVGVVDDSGQEVPCLALSLRGLGTTMTMRPWDLQARASIGSLAVQEMSYGPGGGPLDLLQTPRDAELLLVSYVKADRESPEYHTYFNSTEQAIVIEFSQLTVVLHQEALLRIIEVSGKLLPPSEEAITAKVQPSLESVPTDEGGQSGLTKLASRVKAKKEEEVKIDVRANLDGIKVIVASVDGDLAKILVGGLAARVAVMKDRTDVSASMKDLAVIDSTSGAMYPKIVSIVNEEVFSVKIAVFNDATKGSNVRDMEAVDTSFVMSIGCIRVVFLNRFVMNLLAFLNKFQRAQDALERAKRSATESATATVQSYQKQSSRISLSVTIKAPLVVVPVSSSSEDALVADLGQLTVSNRFSLVDPGTDPEGSDAAIVENMSVQLSSVQLGRAIVKNGQDIGATQLILEPFGLSLCMTRNLSSWFHKIPDIDVSGKLHAIKLCAGEEDLQTLLGVVFQNLSEGKAEDAEKEPAEPVSSPEDVEDAIQLQRADELESADQTPTGDGVWDTVKFAFEIEQVTVALYWKESKLMPGEKTERDPASCLGQVSVVRVVTGGRIKSDTSLYANVTLESCILDDTRPQSEKGVTRMMERFTGRQSSDVPNMVDIKFEQAASQDKNINMEVHNVHIVANLEFILHLANVFTSAMNVAAKPSPTPAPAALSPLPTPAAKSQAVVAPAVEKEPANLQLRFAVQNPEIVLLADAKDKDTNALFLNNSVEFHYHLSHGQQKMFGSVADLRITSAAFDEERRVLTKSPVLHLSHVSMHSSAPEGGAMHIDITTGVARLSMSPPVIKTITACIASLVPAKDEEGSRMKTEVDNSDLWVEKAIDHSQRWYLEPVPKDQLIPGTRILGRWSKNNKYYEGFVSKIDSRIYLQFDDGDKTSHDLNDIAAVLFDRIPGSAELKIGTKVIAKEANDRRIYYYHPSKVVEIGEDENGQVQYTVEMADGKRQANTVDTIRLLPTNKPRGGAIVPSSIVFARCKDGRYSAGFVSSSQGSRLTVRLYTGENLAFDVNDSPALVLDKHPDPYTIQAGTRVIGSWPKTSWWYPGKVTEVKREQAVAHYHVLFDDGDQCWHGADDIRPVRYHKPEVPEGVIDVGTVVWALWTGIRYYKGFVSYKGSKLHVDFYDGDKYLFDLKDAMVTVLPDIVPKTCDIQVDTMVIARFKQRPYYFSGIVKEIDNSDPKVPRFLVQFDDGDKEVNTIDTIRVLHVKKDAGSIGASGEGLFKLTELPDARPVSTTHINPNQFITQAGQAQQAEQADEGSERNELMVLQMEGFELKFEGTFGGQVIPMLTMDGQVQAEVKNWSSKLEASASVSVAANYFNENLLEWEPLIEMIEDEKKRTMIPWILAVKFAMGSEHGGDDGEETNGGGLDVNAEPAMSLAIESQDILQLTVTKTGLDVFKKLGAAFGEAVSLQPGGADLVDSVQPYEVRNELGMGITVRAGDDFEVPAGADPKEKRVAVTAGHSVPLRFGKTFNRRSSRYVKSDGLGPSIGLEVDGFHELRTVSIKQAKVAFYTIMPKKLFQGVSLAVVVQVESGDGQKIVTIRSPLQIHNHFPIPLELCVKKDTSFSKVTVIEENSVYNVPLLLAYRAGLYLKPAGFGYGETTAPLMWTALANAGHRVFTCTPPTSAVAPLYIEVECEKAHFTMKLGMLKDSPSYIFHCYPPVILHNYLPYAFHYMVDGIPYTELKGGSHYPLFSVDVTKKVTLYIQLDDYQGSSWNGRVDLTKGMDELSSFTLEANGKSLDVGVFAIFNGTLNVTVFSPYWMVNKTGMYLEYKTSDAESVIPHPTSLNDAVMLSYHGKGNIFAKKTTRVRLPESEWSDKFSLDAAGSGGSLKIKRHDRIYEIGMQITLSYFSLTKIVEFTPMNLLDNHMEVPIHLCECPDDAALSWITVEPGQCTPYWPSTVPPKDLVIRVGDEIEMSPRFNFEPEATVLLRIASKVGAVCVNMLDKESAAIISFHPYFPGASPVRIENCTKQQVAYQQSGVSKTHVLPPDHCILYTWDDPMGRKEFIWNVEGGEEKITTDFTKAGYGKYVVAGEKTFYWAMFLDGLQRVLFIIDDFTLAYRSQVEQPERASQDIKLDLQGVGLSLVNNEKSIEVAYIGIRPSAVLWEEMKKKGRWRTLNLKYCDELEEAWARVEKATAVGAEPNYRHKIGDMEVDFQLMEMIRPERRPIRRTFLPGVSLRCIISPHEFELFTKVNSVQIDSQVPGSMFQTVLCPVHPPKSLAAENAPKPYVEMSLVARQGEHSQVNQIKYFKVLVQEMDAKVDMGFLMALIELFSSDALDRSQEATQYAADKKRVQEELGQAVAVQAAFSDKRNYFDYFHLSPLKIHVSFSMLGGPAKVDKSQSHIGSSFVSLLLRSVGVAVTEVQDVEFKLAYFEVKNVVYDEAQLMGAVTKHYSSQAIKQMYVLVLGLDVLGNPFGLISGLAGGAKDFFYEPYQGLIQGPGEFAEGLAIGVTSLLGHTVGGAAGAVSRITGTLGKGLAALTLDDEYQQQRRQEMGRKPTGVKQGLQRGGKGLLEGMLGGVTGVVTKPMEGAKKEGAAGFFKGLGKGVVGVVARPVSGVVDFASSTLEGIKGTAEREVVVKRLRPARVFYGDKVIRPYNLYEAEGNSLLQDCKKDKSSLADDSYFAHAVLNRKKVLLITNKHIVVAGEKEVFEGYEVDWSCGLSELSADPAVHGINLVLKIPDKGKSIFKRSECREIKTPGREVAEWLVNKIKEAKS